MLAGESEKEAASVPLRATVKAPVGWFPFT
jgi:hypothetical protein